MLITKADGTQEPFQAEKVANSLLRAGAQKEEVRRIVQKIESELTEGVKTEAIYRKAFQMLHERADLTATKYSLRRALFGLGPTGFPFETFLGRLYEHDGFEVEIGKELRGKCASHELDLIAYKKDDCFIGEAKFHMRPGTKTDLQVALYSYARFLDLKEQKPRADMCGVRSYWIITNTKFTTTVTDYAECVGLKLLSWEYPKKENLQDRIEAARFYPVTVLTSLSRKEKSSLLSVGIVLCRDLVDNHDSLLSVGISKAKALRAVEESRRLCRT